jgi:hypothetical protein
MPTYGPFTPTALSQSPASSSSSEKTWDIGTNNLQADDGNINGVNPWHETPEPPSSPTSIGPVKSTTLILGDWEDGSTDPINIPTNERVTLVKLVLRRLSPDPKATGSGIRDFLISFGATNNADTVTDWPATETEKQYEFTPAGWGLSALPATYNSGLEAQIQVQAFGGPYAVPLVDDDPAVAHLELVQLYIETEIVLIRPLEDQILANPHVLRPFILN